MKPNIQQQQSQQQQVTLATREIVTRFQVETCLQVLGMATSALGHYLHVPVDISERHDFKPLDSETKIAVENLLQTSCERLDRIMKDDERWNTDFQVRIEKQVEETQKLSLEVMQKQKEAAEEITTPHFRYRPSLFRLQDGSWCAFLGDIDYMDQGIIGIGNSAQAAIQAFDDAFRGVINPVVLAWCKEREKNLENGINQDSPFPLDTNENQKLDAERNRKIEDPPLGGENSQGDSQGPGSLPPGD